MKAEDLADVPRDVLDSVWVKWSRALETGWRPGLWSTCKLCDWSHGCGGCPINPGWCNKGEHDTSKLSCHYSDDEDIRPWEERVEEFVSIVREALDNDNKKKANH